MARSKLKGALDQYRGKNIRLEKQRKKEREARKRKGKNKPGENDIDDEDDDLDGGVLLDEVDAIATKNAPKKAKPNGSTEKAATEDSGWDTEDSEEDIESDEDNDIDDTPDKTRPDLSFLEDSDSGGSSDEDAEEQEDENEIEDHEEHEEDIPLSDIESLASEDRGDVIPHQRLTINNTTALTAALNRIQLPYSKLAFSEHQSTVTDEPVEIPDVDDDLNRELAFYKQSLAAVKDARERLKKEGMSFSRPADYFAEMVKSDEHMGKIKQKLVDEAAGKKASAEARRQRDLKKFGKQVQVAKLQERAKEKRDTLEKISLLKRKRSGAEITSTNEEDLFDIELDNTTQSSERRDPSGKPNTKRQKKDAKYGFGGKKRHAKSNDAISTSDARSFPGKKMKGKPVGGAAKRLGKSRRAKRA